MPAIEAAWGDVIDRATIAGIKVKRLRDPAKAQLAAAEFHELTRAMDALLPWLPQRKRHVVDVLVSDLLRANEALWDVEDALRAHEAAGTCSSAEFTELARAVYRTNDVRAGVKAQLSTLLGSRVFEVKSFDHVRAPDDAIRRGKELVVLGHLGLGDQLVTYPLVTELVASNHAVSVVALEQHRTTLEPLYDGSVDFVWLPGTEDERLISPAFGADGQVLRAYREMRMQVLCLGLHAGRRHAPGTPFWKLFYEQCGVDPGVVAGAFKKVRRRRGPEERLREDVLAFHGITGPYVVVHEAPERVGKGLAEQISCVPPPGHGVVRVPGRWRAHGLLDFCALIEGAAEFHGFDSCFAWLVHLMDLRGPRRFMHVYVKGDNDSATLYGDIAGSVPWTDIRAKP